MTLHAWYGAQYSSSGGTRTSSEGRGVIASDRAAVVPAVVGRQQQSMSRLELLARSFRGRVARKGRRVTDGIGGGGGCGGSVVFSVEDIAPLLLVEGLLQPPTEASRRGTTIMTEGRSVLDNAHNMYIYIYGYNL